MKPYITLAQKGIDELTEKRSRFIGLAAPCDTEEAALAFLEDARKQHSTARHVCYAYIITDSCMRFSDAGEPGGTAGMPILEAMRRRGITRACVCVVRYFGGILLGAGGLTRAYAHTAALAVNAAGTVEMTPSERALVACSYALWDRLQYILSRLPVLTEQTTYGADVTAELLLRITDAERVRAEITQQFNAALTLEEMERLWYPWPITPQNEEG